MAILHLTVFLFNADADEYADELSWIWLEVENKRVKHSLTPEAPIYLCAHILIFSRHCASSLEYLLVLLAQHLAFVSKDVGFWL